MPLTAKTIRAQLALLHPLLNSCSLETTRKGQDRLGELMEVRYRRQVLIRNHPFENFTGAWVIPNDERRQGVILYLHGGGYTCGGLEYAKGFGATLAVQCGTRVFCAAYRLAPEYPYPAAPDDAVEAYRYLLAKGYAPERIMLCGESAGGGLCYALCLRLQELALPLPCGVIAISPWTDLTGSGASYEENKEVDCSLSREQLDFYASCYTVDRTDPIVSPLLADLHDLPPSLLFVGGDEILRSDTTELHKKLLAAGCKSQLTVTPQRWHAYVLYGLQEDRGDFAKMNGFLDHVMSRERKLRWMRLDNAAKIYPAAQRQNWSNVFRISATLHDPVDREVLQSAIDVTVRRFPSIASRLRRGVFWYYLQQISEVPEIQEENSYPLVRMTRAEIRRCAFRVVVYKRRIAVEIFHSLTDGNGGLVFFKTLLAEYLQQKYGCTIPAEHGVLGRLEEPSEEEFEDSFLKYAGKIGASRRESTAWHLHGTPEPAGFLDLTCFKLPADTVHAAAKAHGVTVTAFLCAVMMQALLNMQCEQIPNPAKRRPVKVLIPVNLRKLFPSRTLRNFALYTTPEIDSRLGSYSFDEICRAVQHRMGLEVNTQQMRAKIATNVSSERIFIVKILPLFLKNLVMKAVFDAVGERKSCLCLSNLGRIELPEVMLPYIERMDFILGTQAAAPHNCGVLTFGNTLYVNFIRNIREPDLEAHFHCVLRDLGILVEVESNRPER